jgi:hypothetical protein
MNDIYFVDIQHKLGKNATTSGSKGDPRNGRDIHTDTNCHLSIKGEIHDMIADGVFVTFVDVGIGST